MLGDQEELVVEGWNFGIAPREILAKGRRLVPI
jgi:hypothetical protein